MIVILKSSEISGDIMRKLRLISAFAALQWDEYQHLARWPFSE